MIDPKDMGRETPLECSYYELVCNVAIQNISIPIVKEAEPTPKKYDI